MSIHRGILIAAAGTAGLALGFVARGQLDPPPPPTPQPIVTMAPPVPAPVSAPTPAPRIDSPAVQAAFDQVYRNATWGKNVDNAGTSGFGSTMAATAVYRTFLQQFMKTHDTKSVVDAGCGDWESTQAIDWKGIDYKGYDVVESVVAKDKKLFEKPNIHFFQGDIVATDLPPADLLIVKQVLQHLPNAAIATFLPQLSKYKNVLIMNSVSRRTLTSDNPDIRPGEFRPLDLTKPPFNLSAGRLLTYWDGGNMQQLLHIAPKR